MRTRSIRKVMLGVALGALVGCTTYHRVTDSETGESFYTTNWDMHQYSSSDAVRFKDHTGEVHILNQAQVTQIVEGEYRDNTGN